MRGFILVVVLGWFAMGEAVANAERQQAIADSSKHEKLQNYQEAIQALKAVYLKDKSSYWLNLKLGWLFFLSGHYANSSFHYEEALTLKHESLEPLLGLMLVSLTQENYERVEQVGYRLLKQDFNNYYGNLRLAQALRWQHKVSAGLSVVDKMLILYPSDIEFLLIKAQLKQQEKKTSEARELYQQVLEVEPSNDIASQALKNIS